MSDKITTVIVEDSKDNREALKTLLKNQCPDVEAMGEAPDIDTAYSLIVEQEPELVFLDIQLKNHTSFDLLDRLMKNNSVDFEIIFITAHGSFEYATRAIAYSALDFITKPISSKGLRKAVEKARERLNRENYKEQIRKHLHPSVPGQPHRRASYQRRY